MADSKQTGSYLIKLVCDISNNSNGEIMVIIDTLCHREVHQTVFATYCNLLHPHSSMLYYLMHLTYLKIVTNGFLIIINNFY